MEKAFQILEDNFRLSSDDYIKLLGMLQELQQHRDKLAVSNARRDRSDEADQRKQLMEMDTA